MKRSVVYEGVLMALYAAMFVVLDYVSNQIGFFRMPNGGTIGLSTVILLVASYQLGPKKGLIVALLTIPLQFLAAPIYAVNALDFFFEYVLAFAIYGIASIFPNFQWKFPIYTGVVIVNLVRLAIHVFAGVVYWKSTWWASLIYNAWYMIPTLLVGLLLTPSIVERIKR